MVLNDFRRDLTCLSKSERKLKKSAAMEAGTTPQYITNLTARGRVVNPVFVKLTQAFGYDIIVEYVKRDSAGDDAEVS